MAILSYGAIYLVHCTANDGVYIGQTKNPERRQGDHWGELRRGKHGNRYLQRAWDKYGETSFVYVILEYHDTLVALNEAESFFIEYFKSISVSLFNLRSGGGVSRQSEETKRRISASQKGRTYSESTLAKMRAAVRPKHLTEEHKRKISEAGKGRVQTAEQRAKYSATRQGHSVSPETREKIRKALLGGPAPIVSPDARKRGAEKQRGKKKPEQQRENWMRAMHPDRVYQITSPDGEVFETRDLVRFCLEHRLNHHSIFYVANGKRKQCRGWKAVILTE